MSEVLDYTGIPIEVGQKVAVHPCSSSYGAYKTGTVLKVTEDSFCSKVRIEYDDVKCYANWEDPQKIYKHCRRRLENITEPQCMFEVKKSVATIDPNSVIVLRDKEIYEKGKRFYISEYEARKLEQNNKES